MKRKILRRQRDEWCEIEISLVDGRLSVTGAAGEILSRRAAKRHAYESWVSYWDDVTAEERESLGKQLGCRSANGFAKRVQEADGDLHGIDVHCEDGNEVFVVHVFGQIQEELGRFFPEAAELLPWHLNDLKPDCEHQEAAVADGREKYEIGDACEVCGYRYGSEWKKRKLPAHIIRLAETVYGSES